jgi:hypothetical protein
MAEGKMKSLWGIASNLMALQANCNRDPKKHSAPFKPTEFNPFTQQKTEIIHDTKEAFQLMRKLWIGEKT